ncbi:hypothetical protein HID58_082014, partial [Brassica napus]
MYMLSLMSRSKSFTKPSVFCLIDKHSDITKVMKSMGKNPKAKQLQEMMSDVDIFGDDGIITFDDFLYIMVQNTSQESASECSTETETVTTRPVGPRLTALQRTDPNPSIMGTTCPIIRDSLIYALELGEGMKDMGMKITAEEAERMVREADLDGDGTKDMELKITAEQAEHMVREADLDGDGFLSFHEFSKMMMETIENT